MPDSHLAQDLMGQAAAIWYGSGSVLGSTRRGSASCIAIVRRAKD